jgi:hypothetical protein
MWESICAQKTSCDGHTDVCLVSLWFLRAICSVAPVYLAVVCTRLVLLMLLPLPALLAAAG